jgi:hypothetical protein
MSEAVVIMHPRAKLYSCCRPVKGENVHLLLKYTDEKTIGK